MNYNFFDRIKFIFQYNDSFFHNLFLTLLLLVFILCVVSFLRNLRLKNKVLPNRKVGKTVVVILPSLLFPVILYTVISFALMDASSVGIVDQLVVGKDFYSLQTVSNAISTGKINRVKIGTHISKISLTNPKENWRKKIHSGKSESALFLGETETGVYYRSADELEGIDKKTGEKILTSESLVKKNPQLKGALSSDESRYRLFPEKNQLTLETNIGDQYQLDLKNLKVQKLADDSINFNGQKGSAVNQAKIAADMISSLEYATTVASADQRFPYLSFLSSKTIKEAEKIKDFSTTGPELDTIDFFEKTPKYLYGFGYSDEASRLSFTKIGNQRWIDPKFILVDASNQETNKYSITEPLSKKDGLDNTSEQIVSVPQDDFFGSMAYSFAARLLTVEVPSTPLTLDEENLLVVHSETAERDSNLLISLWDTKSNEVRWTVKTNSSRLKDYSLSNNSLIFTVNSKQGSDQIIMINIKTGRGTGYDFKYNDVFEVNKI